MNGTRVVLEKEDLLIDMAQTEGFETQSYGGITVVLDKALTPELIEEGFVRELVSKIQTMRKEAGFEVMDRITVYASGNEKIEQILRDNEKSVAADVLADGFIFNETDGYWVTAELSTDGVYYVKGADAPAGHVAGTADEDGSKGTTFIPNASTGVLQIFGLEDDAYVLTEVKTDNGYTLLKDDIRIVITSAEDDSRPCGIYDTDVLGLVQNDPRFRTFDGYQDLAHVLLTASATVDGDSVRMEAYDDSTNAMVPLTVINTRGPELPKTGDNGVWMYGVIGGCLLLIALSILLMTSRKKSGK